MEEEEVVFKTRKKINEEKSKKKSNLIVSVAMPKFKLQILEAQDLEKELLKGLRERLGANNLTRRDKQLLELDIKFKGLPFLDFEFNKFCIKHF